MDNNFNMQQPTEQSMYQQMPQQQMYQQPVQQPMYQQAPQQQMYQQPAQQPMYQQAPQQQMYQQPMGQPMYNNMYQQPKKKTGLIIGIIAAIVVLIAAIVTIVLVLVLGGDKDKDGGSSKESKIVGTWESDTGITMVIKENNTGSMSMYGQKLSMEWELDGDVLSVVLSYDDEETSQDLTIVELTDSEMVLEDESGDEENFTRVK